MVSMQTAFVYAACVGCGVSAAIVMWRRQTRLLQLAAAISFSLLAVITTLAAIGWPLYRAGMQHTALSSDQTATLHQVHHALGHFSLPAIAVVAPILVAAAAVHRHSVLRRVTHMLAVLVIVFGWFICAIAGYLLPDNIQHPLPHDAAPAVLRFALLHMLGIPAIVAVLLLSLGWRHMRLARRVAA